MKRIEIIPLALKKMEQRKILREWVEETLNFPERIVEGYRGRKIRQKRYSINGKEMLLRVVVDEDEDKFVVITAYLTSRVDRY